MASGATREMYQHSLVSAQETMDQALEAKTNHEREKLGVELATFLGGLGPGYATDLLHVGAEDLLVFMEAHWQQHHAGSSLPGLDYLVASPSGLRSALSHLFSFCFVPEGNHSGETPQRIGQRQRTRRRRGEL